MKQIDLTSGRLLDARFSESPNQNERPAGCEISLLVIHNISLPPEDFGGDWIEDFFLNRLNCDAHPYFERLRGVEVSAHLLIRRNGECLQFVPFHRRAWHAGRSSFDGQENCNDFSIGIELEGSDHQAFSDAQYECLAQISQTLMKCYPGITEERITGHSDIAPGRKTDPGPFFDWNTYRQRLSTLLSQPRGNQTL